MANYMAWRKTSTKRILAVVWSLACIAGNPDIVSYNQVTTSDQSSTHFSICYTSLFQSSKRWYHSTYSCLVLLAFMLSLYWNIRITITRNRQRATRNRKRTILFMAVISVIFICILPQRILILLVSIVPELANSLSHTLLSILFEIFDIMSLFHIVLTPLMFKFASKKINRSFRKLLSYVHILTSSNTKIPCRLCTFGETYQLLNAIHEYSDQ